jgi:hypothetical protein
MSSEPLCRQQSAHAALLTKTQAAERPMQQGGALCRLRVLSVYQVIPSFHRQSTDFGIIAKPVESMKVQATGGVHVIKGECLTTATVQWHQRTPIL